MKATIATNRSGFIGINGYLPWVSKEDLEHFKSLTDGQTLLVGYNTHLTLPELKNRTTIVDNDNIDISNIDWCIGGKKTYEKYCHLFTELHISVINDYSIGDTLFPELKNLNPKCKLFFYEFDVNDTQSYITKLVNDNIDSIYVPKDMDKLDPIRIGEHKFYLTNANGYFSALNAINEVKRRFQLNILKF